MPLISRSSRFVAWAKTPASPLQAAAILLALSSVSVAAWLSPQTRHALVARVQKGAASLSKPIFEQQFAASVTDSITASVAELPPLLPHSRVMTRANARQAASTFTVNSTADFPDANPADGVCQTSSANGAVCTLRAAIQTTNAVGGGTINFNIPGAGVQTIAPLSALPTITKPRTTIDGYSQPGASANTLNVGNNAKILIELSGASAGASSAGLSLFQRNDPAEFQPGDGTVVRGLAINRWSRGSGVRVATNGNTVAGCFIGTDVTGTIARGNASGVAISFGGSNTGIFANSNTIGGAAPGDRNIISGNGTNSSAPGVSILQGGSNNTIQNNTIGLDASGTKALGNSGPGVQLNSVEGDERNNSIIGNLISGNGSAGVELSGVEQKVSNNVVRANKIGTDATGTKVLGNGGAGVSIARATGNTIGGTNAGEGNLISGNALNGIALINRSNSNLIQGNLIGTNAAGDQAIGNGANGVFIDVSSGNIIGGTVAGARNIISGNGFTADGGGIPGLAINASDNNTVQGNYVGTNAAGLIKLPNAAEGISLSEATGTLVENNLVSGNTFTGIALFDGAANNILRGNKIGLNAAGAPTLGNGLSGIGLGSLREGVLAQTAGNRITANSIAGNGALGIDLGTADNPDTFTGDGVTPNDAGDADSGPNGLQNFPIITGVSGQVVSGTLNSYVSEDFRIEVFASDAADPSGSGEGQIFLGAVDGLKTDAQGNLSWSFTSPVAVAGKSLSATAIYVSDTGTIGGAGLARDGDTSEFSLAFAASVAPRNRQPAIIGTAGASNVAVVFPDAGELPTPTQNRVLGLPDGAQPHGVSYFGRDNALISDFNNSRIFVVQISTATVLSTINTASAGYNGNGTIAVSPDLSAALAMGSGRNSDNRVYVIRGPFSATSVITPVALPGSIPSYQTQAIVFNGAGRAFISHTAGISVIDAPYNAVAFTIPLDNPDGGAVAIAPDGNTLLVTKFDDTVSVFSAPFSATSVPAVLRVANTDGLDGIVVTPDGSKALVVSGADPQAFAISTPFNATSAVQQIPMPATVSFNGFEDIGISADSQIAIFTGNSDGTGASDPAVFARAPFGTASQTFAVPIQSGTANTRRGAGSVRFLPPGLAPGLTISKSAPATVASGQTLTYTLSFQNTGTLDAAGVVIRDPLPTGTSFVSATNGGALAGGNVVFNIGALQAGGAARTVSFTARATAAAGTTLTNANYSIEATGVTPVVGPPVTTSVVAAKVNTSTALTSSLNPSTVGQNVTFTATVTPASGTLQPAGTVTFKDGATTLGTGTLASGSATFATTSLTAGTHSITATYGGNASFGASTSAITTQVVNATATLPTLSIDDVSLVEGNSGTKNLTFTVTLTGTMQGAASVRYATSNGTATAGSDYTATSGTLSFQAASADRTAKAVQTISVPISGDTAREADETFFVTLSNPQNATPLRAQGTGTIQNDDLVADLSVTQTASLTSVIQGGEVVFTITIKNNGPDSAQNVTLSDTLPTGATLISSTPTPTSQNGAVLSFKLGTFASGATQTVTLRVRAPQSVGTLQNSASVAGSGATDPTMPNNGASVSIPITGGAPAFKFALGKLRNIGPYSPSLYGSGTRFSQTLRITNSGTAPANVPLRVVLDGLSDSISLVNARGIAENGKPYIDVPLSQGSLAIGQSVTVSLEFRSRGGRKPSFSPRVVLNGAAP